MAPSSSNGFPPSAPDSVQAEKFGLAHDIPLLPRRSARHIHGAKSAHHQKNMSADSSQSQPASHANHRAFLVNHACQSRETPVYAQLAMTKRKEAQWRLGLLQNDDKALLPTTLQPALFFSQIIDWQAGGMRPTDLLHHKSPTGKLGV